jgi:hypothetical protein
MNETRPAKLSSPGAKRGTHLVTAVLVVLGLAVAAFLVVGFSIGAGVRDISERALRDHPGDKVAALMALVESEAYSFRERNRAIWALGQLGDPRALPLLQKLSMGRTSDETVALYQYELKKAIALCRGGTNISALVWRRGP